MQAVLKQQRDDVRARFDTVLKADLVVLEQKLRDRNGTVIL